MNHNALDQNYLAKIAQRMAEKTLEGKVAIKKPEKRRSPKIPIVIDKVGYVYVPSLRLYISETPVLYGTNWQEIQEKFHTEGIRMPTILEFVEFLKYLRSKDGKAEELDADKILDSIWTPDNSVRGEYLDAQFNKKNDGLYLTCHTFDNLNSYSKTTSNGIIEIEERLNPIYNSTSLDIGSCLERHTKSGLPKMMCLDGDTYCYYPQDGKIAAFFKGPNRTALHLDLPDNSDDKSLGARMVRKSRK